MQYSNLEDPVPKITKRFNVVHARSLVMVHVSADDVIRNGNAFFLEIIFADTAAVWR